MVTLVSSVISILVAFIALAIASSRARQEELGKRRHDALLQWRALVGTWLAEAEHVRLDSGRPGAPITVDELFSVLHERASKAIVIAFDMTSWERLVVHRNLPDLLGESAYNLALRIPYDVLAQDSKYEDVRSLHLLQLLFEASKGSGGKMNTLTIGSVGLMLHQYRLGLLPEVDPNYSPKEKARFARNVIGELEPLSPIRRRDWLREHLDPNRVKLARDRRRRRRRPSSISSDRGDDSR